MVPFVDIHTHKSQQSVGVIAIQSLSISERIFLAMPKIKPITVGIHPWYSTANELSKNMKYLKVLARQENVKMIGECGLDKLKGESMEHQLIALAEQIKLAEELKKPVILHCVKAFDELIAIKKQLKPTVPMVIHGFNKAPELAKQLSNQGFLLSFGASVLSNADLASAIIQMEKPFFLETDDSTVSVEDVYSKVAEIKKITVNELKDIIFANCKILNLF